MLTKEVTPSFAVRLASVKLTLKSLLSEVETIEQELGALGGSIGDWLPADQVAARAGLRSERQLLAWAREVGLSHKLAGKVRFFKVSELTAAIERGDVRTGSPARKPTKPITRDTAAETFSKVFAIKGGK